MVELVNHPSHYGGADNLYEHVKVMEATLSREQFIGAMIYLTSKHHFRLGKKDGMTTEVDAGKAAWYAARLRDYLMAPPKPSLEPEQAHAWPDLAGLPVATGSGNVLQDMGGKFWMDTVRMGVPVWVPSGGPMRKGTP